LDRLAWSSGSGISAISSSPIVRGAPGRGSSKRPSTRPLAKRVRQRPTVCWLPIPSRSVFVAPQPPSISSGSELIVKPRVPGLIMERPSKRAQFVHGMRAYSAHNRLHVNAPAPCRFAQSYMTANMLWRITLATNRRFGVVIYTAAAGNQGTLGERRRLLTRSDRVSTNR
jgi:hypothetical protein